MTTKSKILCSAALIIAAGLWGTANACEGCVNGASSFVRIGVYTNTMRLGGTSAEVYAARGGEFYRIAAAYHYKQYENAGLSSRKEAYDRAIADFNEALKISVSGGGPAAAYNYFKARGNIHLSASNFALAIADYSEAIRLNPRDTVTPYPFYRDYEQWHPRVLSDGLYFARGAAHYITGAYGKAIEDFETARRTRIADEDFLAETAMEFAKKRLAAKSRRPPEAEREFFRGLAYYNFHDTDNERYGLKYFEAALKLDSSNADYHRMAGLACIKPGNYAAYEYMGFEMGMDRARAIEHFSKAVRLAPNDAKNHAAQANYAQALLLAPNVPEYRIARAAQHIAKKEYGEALAHYLEAVKSDSGIVCRARALQMRDRYRETYSIGHRDKKFDTLLCAELKRAYNYGDELCCKSVTHRESAWRKEKGLSPAPDTEEYHYTKAKAFTYIIENDSAESAIAHYTKLIRRFQRNAPYYAMRAVAWAVAHEMDDRDSARALATADYVKAVEQDSSFLYWEWIEVADIFPRSGMTRCYIIDDVYDELLRKSPRNAEYHYQKGIAMGTITDSAIASFNRAVRLKPGEAAYHKILGDAHLRRGNCAKAAESHLKAMRLDPKGMYLFLNPYGYPIKGYRAMLDKALAGGKPVPAAECGKMDNLWENDYFDE